VLRSSDSGRAPGRPSAFAADAPTGYAHCLALVRTDIHGLVRRNTPSGYSPGDLQTAYDLTSYSSSNGKGQTVAIVDAYVNPNAAKDLAVYRSQYALSSCTVSNGCFATKAFGSSSNTGWAEEESLDVDMVSAICPNCHIILVEAASSSLSALVTAEQYATQHANYVSNSWSGDEGTKTYDGDFNVSGVAITAATGDSGYNSTAQWPAIPSHRYGGWRNLSIVVQPSQGECLVGCRKRLQQDLCEAQLPERAEHRLRRPRGGRYVGRCRSEYRRRSLRFVS